MLFQVFKKKKKIGLALGSGGARGLAHIGVLKTLLKHHIPIDYIAGSSAGALIGGMYSANPNTASLEALANDIEYKDLFSIFNDPFSKLGIIKGSKMEDFLRKHVGRVNIEKLSIPFCAVASDIRSGKAIPIRHGDLAIAIRASSSIPFILQPIEMNNCLLVDGGVSEPIPIEIVREMGADIVIGVNLYSSYDNRDKKKSVTAISVLVSSFELMLHHLAKDNEEKADIVVKPEIPSSIPYIGLLEFVHNQELIKRGEEATEKIITKIKKLMK